MDDAADEAEKGGLRGSLRDALKQADQDAPAEVGAVEEKLGGQGEVGGEVLVDCVRGHAVHARHHRQNAQRRVRSPQGHKLLQLQVQNVKAEVQCTRIFKASSHNCFIST